MHSPNEIFASIFFPAYVTIWKLTLLQRSLTESPSNKKPLVSGIVFHKPYGHTHTRDFAWNGLNMDVWNGSNTTLPLIETVDEINLRYANTLFPLATILGVFCVLGIGGNIIVLCVFSLSGEYKPNNFKIFVICIAIIDLLTCMIHIPAEILKTRHFFSFPSLLDCKVKCFFNILGLTSSANVFMVISVDRYRKICQPFKKQLTTRLAIACIIAVIALSLVTALPAALLCDLQEKNMTNIHKTLTAVTVCSAEDKYAVNKQFVYLIWMSLWFLCVFIVLIVMYILVIKKIAKHWKRRTSNGIIRFDAIMNRSKCPCNEHAFIPTDVDKVNDAFHDRLSIDTNGQRPCNHGHNLISKGQNVPLQSSRKLLLGKLDSHQYTQVILNIQGDQCEEEAGNANVKPNSRSRPTSDAQISKQQPGSSPNSQRKLPYKSIIWVILTLIFLVSFFINVSLIFLTTKAHTFEPSTLLWYLIFYRLHFINNIINPLIYALLDTRFKSSYKTLLVRAGRLLHLN